MKNQILDLKEALDKKHTMIIKLGLESFRSKYKKSVNLQNSYNSSFKNEGLSNEALILENHKLNIEFSSFIEEYKQQEERYSKKISELNNEILKLKNNSLSNSTCVKNSKYDQQQYLE
jgi:hypothetical protein